MSGFAESPHQLSVLVKEEIKEEECERDYFKQENLFAVPKEEEEHGRRVTTSSDITSPTLFCKEENSPLEINLQCNSKRSGHKDISPARHTTRVQHFGCSSNNSTDGSRRAGEKPHQCPECGKAFNYASTLKAHQRNHRRAKSSQRSTTGETYWSTKTAVKRPSASLRKAKHQDQKRQECEVEKKATLIKVILCNVETDRVTHLERRLTDRTAQLEAEKARKEEIDAEIVSLKAENDNLRRQIQRLQSRENGNLEVLKRMRAVGACFGLSAADGQLPRCASTSASESGSSTLQRSPSAPSVTINDGFQGKVSQYADVMLRDVGPEDHARILQRSFGQVGRYGCLLFRAVISDEDYRAWSKTTNWDGSRGKRELPQNVKNFVVSTLKEKFPAVKRSEIKDCIYKINEFLRTTRTSSLVV